MVVVRAYFSQVVALFRSHSFFELLLDADAAAQADLLLNCQSGQVARAADTNTEACILLVSLFLLIFAAGQRSQYL